MSSEAAKALALDLDEHGVSLPFRVLPNVQMYRTNAGENMEVLIIDGDKYTNILEDTDYRLDSSAWSRHKDKYFSKKGSAKLYFSTKGRRGYPKTEEQARSDAIVIGRILTKDLFERLKIPHTVKEGRIVLLDPEQMARIEEEARIKREKEEKERKEREEEQRRIAEQRERERLLTEQQVKELRQQKEREREQTRKEFEDLLLQKETIEHTKSLFREHLKESIEKYKENNPRASTEDLIRYLGSAYAEIEGVKPYKDLTRIREGIELFSSRHLKRDFEETTARLKDHITSLTTYKDPSYPPLPWYQFIAFLLAEVWQEGIEQEKQKQASLAQESAGVLGRVLQKIDSKSSFFRMFVRNVEASLREATEKAVEKIKDYKGESWQSATAADFTAIQKNKIKAAIFSAISPNLAEDLDESAKIRLINEIFEAIFSKEPPKPQEVTPMAKKRIIPTFTYSLKEDAPAFLQMKSTEEASAYINEYFALNSGKRDLDPEESIEGFSRVHFLPEGRVVQVSFYDSSVRVREAKLIATDMHRAVTETVEETDKNYRLYRPSMESAFCAALAIFYYPRLIKMALSIHERQYLAMRESQYTDRYLAMRERGSAEYAEPNRLKNALLDVIEKLIFDAVFRDLGGVDEF